jgi:hypothetical protein
VASESKLLRVGSVEHHNRNHPLDRVIKFLERLKQRRESRLLGAINEAPLFGHQTEFHYARGSGDMTADGAVNCSIVSIE